MSAEKKNTKKLYRSVTDRYVGGVCGGLGDYFKVDSNIFRILFVITAFTGGIGILVYLIAYFIVPENPETSESSSKKLPHTNTFLLAIILITLGSLLLVKDFGLFNYFYFWHLPWSSIWAVFLIVLGFFIILTSNNTKQADSDNPEDAQFESLNKIYRSRKHRYIAGVCGGIGEYFSIDPSIIRLLWIFASVASAGLGFLVYVILIFVFPEYPYQEKE